MDQPGGTSRKFQSASVDRFIFVYLRKTQADDLLFTTLALIAVAAVFIAFTTPNMGSLSRYKSLYIPYYMFLVSFFPFRYLFPPKQST